MEQTRISLFQRPVWVVVFALTAAIAWGWAFPLIKVGFIAFGITADMTGSKNVGMSHSEGSRAAILNSLCTFLVVLLACACFKSDRLTSRKIIGCAVGFCGILALNLGAAESGQFSWLGDGMIILNAICSAIAALMTRRLSRRIDVFVGTGIVCLLLLIAISALGFALYNKLLSMNPVGKVAIYNNQWKRHH